MAEITQWSQLDNVLELILRDALNELGEMINDKMKAQIDYDVYVGQNKVYEPTYEFRESYESKDVTKDKRNPEVLIKSNPDKMSLDSDNFVHGSNYSRRGDDVRGVLDDILANNLSGNITKKWFGDGFWRHRDSYFDNTLKALEVNGWLSKTFKQLLRKRGLVVK